MCKKYKIEVVSKYGMYTKEANTYNEIMEEYKETKELFNDVPCDIKVTSTENILFTKKGDVDTFEKLYNNLKEDLKNRQGMRFFDGSGEYYMVDNGTKLNNISPTFQKVRSLFDNLFNKKI